MKTKYISITYCQQGGIGYPPMIIRLNGKWYAISDSRMKRTKDEFYDVAERDRWHSQYWALKKFNRTKNSLTMKEVEKRLQI